MILAISTIQFVNILLVLVFLFLGFKLLERKWSYRISKPHNWDDATKNNRIPKQLKKLERTYRDKVRFYTFWLQIERIKDNKIAGDFAELGVYKGVTAKIIHAMAPDVAFHLFDTFEGFHDSDLALESSNEEKYHPSNFSDTDLEAVRYYINGNANIKFYPGYFPDTATDLQEKTFAFVHLDADLYQPTLAALKYFYPRLSPGGVIIIHDYNHTWGGLRQAVDEFIPTIPESLMAIADWQGSAMIVKNRYPN